MSKLIVQNTFTEVEGKESQVEHLLRFRPAGYTFSPKYKSGHWDGWISFVKHSKNKLYIPTGLIQYVQDNIDGFSIEDMRKMPPKLVGYMSPTQAVALDNHQLDAVQHAQILRRGLIQYPTGTGKARIIGETIRRLNVSTLVLCDKRDLLHQLHREITNAIGNDQVGIIGDGHDTRFDVTIATYQGIMVRLNDPDKAKGMLANLAEFGCVIVDETHHATASGLREILGKMPNAYYRFGFSATAFKGYKGKTADLGTFLGVQAYLGPPISTMTISEGVETGRIVPANIFMVHGCEWEGKALNYSEEYSLGIINNSARNTVIIRLAMRLRNLGPTIVLVSREEHGNNIVFSDVPYIYGKTPSKLRNKYYDEFRNGERNCLIIGKLGDEALDLPNIRYLILAGGGNSPHVQIQRIGRGMRAVEGKDKVDVFDFADTGHYISAHYRRRRRAYEQEPAYTVIDLTKEELLP